MTSRKASLVFSVATLALVAASGARAAVDSIEITTTYATSAPPGTLLGAYTPSPDTSFLSFTNVGTTTFTGSVSDSAVSAGGTDFSQLFNVTLAPGQTVVFATSPESSNQGGFGGPTATVQPGIEAIIGGVFSDGFVPIGWSVFDSMIHSGVVNGGSEGSDAYVLQGGSPTGLDYGDAIEEAQAPGHFTFTNGAVPEPSTWAMMLIGFAGLGYASYRARRKGAALQA
jgi:hypothetical protein